MRLADFILANIEPILSDWETFARSIAPGAKMDRLALRDHAAEILRATARDMVSAQSAEQRRDKSEGNCKSESLVLNGASELHAVGRVDSGFNLIEMVAEYRALRASVIRLWLKGTLEPAAWDTDDLIRFNESIDQSLTAAVGSYTLRIDRSRQMFLAILGHDLRGPLNAAMMSAQLLIRSGKLDDESSETAAQISTSTVAMARMISDILDFTASSLGAKMPISPAIMDLAQLCQQVIAETQAAHPTCTLHFKAEGELTGMWDADRLRQVVSNLLGNAVQHGTGPVDLTLSVEGSDAVLAVRNGGTPIPPDVLPTLFDPLVRGTSPPMGKQRRHGSIGLGLYIAREIVIAHDGTIVAESSEQSGTVFLIRLPRHRASN